MIIAHLTYDTRSLLACSLTCYSWYTAAVLRLHRTLIIQTRHWYTNEKFWWPRPLLYMRELGLLPLVKEFQVHTRRDTDINGFSPELFNRFILRQFSALTNVQELGIDHLNIPKFMPRIRRYFGHFFPTVRSLALRTPRGSRRQIIYFIGLFPHLDDLKLLGAFNFQEGQTSDLTLVPPFTPPLRGRLTMSNLRSVGFLKDMIDLFGGIRFCYMDLFEVEGMWLLLDACVETLEVLRLCPTDFCGEKASLDGIQDLADDFSASRSLGNVDLSRNKSLRALEVMASSILLWEPGLLMHALSTITSPAFSEVIVFHRDYDFYGVGSFPHLCVFHLMSKDEAEKEALRHHMQFELFRKMHRVRGFRLVLCANVWDRVVEYTMRVLKQAVAVEKAKGGFYGPIFEPLLIYSPRRFAPVLAEIWCSGALNPWAPL